MKKKKKTYIWSIFLVAACGGRGGHWNTAQTTHLASFGPLVVAWPPRLIFCIVEPNYRIKTSVSMIVVSKNMQREKKDT
jgi:hypothetical protein